MVADGRSLDAAQYTINDDDALLAGSLPTVNQQQTPAGDQAAGVYWQELGVYQAQSGTLGRALDVDNYGEDLADSVRIVPQATAR